MSPRRPNPGRGRTRGRKGAIPRRARAPRLEKKPGQRAGGVKGFPDPVEMRLAPAGPSVGHDRNPFPMRPLEHDRAHATRPLPSPSLAPSPSHERERERERERSADDASFSRALTQGLNTPLAALRATMESL